MCLGWSLNAGFAAFNVERWVASVLQRQFAEQTFLFWTKSRIQILASFRGPLTSQSLNLCLMIVNQSVVGEYSLSLAAGVRVVVERWVSNVQRRMPVFQRSTLLIWKPCAHHALCHICSCPASIKVGVLQPCGGGTKIRRT